VGAGGAVTTVLLVCHANTCRSVMAHVLLERMLAERNGHHQIRVLSFQLDEVVHQLIKF